MNVQVLLPVVIWLHLSISHPPTPVSINGRPTLYYELQLINTSPHPVTVDKLIIKSPRSTLAVFEKDQLRSRTATHGDTTLIYIELTTKKVPDLLIHQLRLHTGDGVRGTTLVDHTPPIVLGPPFRNGTWAAVREPSWERGHRRATYTVDGRTRIPGRFAIDFIRLDDNGHYARGNEDSIRNWLGYSTEVLAVADGVVTAIRNDFPQSNTLSTHPKYPSSQAAGNFITIQAGKDRFIFYEHLQPGSIRVRPGQTTGPHLHLHVADANSPLGAEGIPFVFDSFTLIGSYPDLAVFGKKKWIQEKLARIQKEYPAPNTVIRF